MMKNAKILGADAAEGVTAERSVPASSAPHDARSDGGPAFPSYDTHQQFDEDRGKYVDVILPVGGMSLRDYFAAKAMQSLIPAYCQGQPEPQAPWISKVAYEFADAMLKERAK